MKVNTYYYLPSWECNLRSCSKNTNGFSYLLLFIPLLAPLLCYSPHGFPHPVFFFFNLLCWGLQILTELHQYVNYLQKLENKRWEAYRIFFWCNLKDIKYHSIKAFLQFRTFVTQWLRTATLLLNWKKKCSHLKTVLQLSVMETRPALKLRKLKVS